MDTCNQIRMPKTNQFTSMIKGQFLINPNVEINQWSDLNYSKSILKQLLRGARALYNSKDMMKISFQVLLS